MNKEDIYQLLRDSVITTEQAMEYMDNISINHMDNISINHDADFNIDDLLAAYEEDTYEEHTFTQLNDNVRVLRREVKKVLDLWTGLYKTGFQALTPDILINLNDRCQRIQADAASRDRLLINCSNLGYTQEELSECISVYGCYEKALVYCIMQSWCLSNGQDIDTAQHREKLSSFDRLHLLNDFNHDMLKIVKVTPWEMPPCPPLSIPERPAVILEVIQVLNNCVKAGFNDIFNPLVMVESLPVDEILKIGDKIIVKGSKCDRQTLKIQEPEYDGIAEPNCPLSTVDELLELNYTFNHKKESDELMKRHKNDWMQKHWTVLTESEILKMVNKNNLDKTNSASVATGLDIDSIVLDEELLNIVQEWGLDKHKSKGDDFRKYYQYFLETSFKEV